jgi:D-alanyl-D-alanine carboxypeptidase/D-alanyl-D-alanine-endopeptidase (penicillin-binding protein 4)
VAVQSLAAKLANDVGISRVEGQVIGDESYFDRLRGTPASGYARSSFLEGQLGALTFDRGLTGDGGFQSRPATYAAQQLVKALKDLGVTTGGAHEGTAPPGATALAQVDSPPMATLTQLTDRSSDNFFAETLLKDLGASFGVDGTTVAGAAVVGAQLRRLGVRAHVIDGSGLSYDDTTTPRQVVRFLARLRRSPVDAAFEQSLAVAGRSGTLARRMGGTTAEGRCRAKTGTLPGVSALSGYCDARSGHRIAFSFLFNRVGDIGLARVRQDIMTIALARSSRD